MSARPGAREGLILAVNAGSSSIKFALYGQAEPLARVLSGEIERIGQAGARLVLSDAGGGERAQGVAAKDHRAAGHAMLDALQDRLPAVAAAGHRIVHGMERLDPEAVTPALLEHLRRIVPCDPEHLPQEIALIEALRDRSPGLAQIACFDTAFHRDLPRVARLLPIPLRYAAMGIRRYGFHGLSYAYLMEELACRAGDPAARGRIILAHLGSGASMAAVRDGRCIDTSMGFTPAGGMPMGTRPGDLDPGVASYLLRTGEVTPEAFNALVNRESGLLGLSGSSADMRDLMAREHADERAADAIALFCYQARKWIGAFAAALEGLDTLIFSGGIGEHAPVVRARICEGLAHLGIALDAKRNRANADVISRDAAAVAVRVIPTDEEVMIARTVRDVLAR